MAISDELLRQEKYMGTASSINRAEFAAPLHQIRLGRLWQATEHASFEDYCRERWGLTPAATKEILRKHGLA